MFGRFVPDNSMGDGASLYCKGVGYVFTLKPFPLLTMVNQVEGPQSIHCNWQLWGDLVWKYINTYCNGGYCNLWSIFSASPDISVQSNTHSKALVY